VHVSHFLGAAIQEKRKRDKIRIMGKQRGKVLPHNRDSTRVSPMIQTYTSHSGLPGNQKYGS